MILDTNALSAAADGDPSARALLADADSVVIPVIVLGEYRIGVAESRRRADYQTWLGGLMGSSTILNVDEETSRHYAEISIELRRIGRPIPTNDIWIAALCRQHARALLSRDRHFDYVQRLKRIAW